MSWIKSVRGWRLALPLFLLMVPVPVLSLLVRPILLDMKSSGSGTNSSFEVVNDRNRPITVEVTVQNLEIPERGEIKLTPNDGANFQIFPPIASVPAGKKQVFRVKWIGAPDIAESQLYIFSTAELPIKRDPTESSAAVEILYAINSIVAVAPANQKPRLSLLKAERATSKEGKPGIEFTFSNDGPAHGYVANSQIGLTIGGSSWSATIDQSNGGKGFGLGLVPPNSKRVMFVPLDDVPATGDIVSEFKTTLGPDRRAL